MVRCGGIEWRYWNINQTDIDSYIRKRKGESVERSLSRYIESEEESKRCRESVEKYRSYGESWVELSKNRLGPQVVKVDRGERSFRESVQGAIKRLSGE